MTNLVQRMRALIYSGGDPGGEERRGKVHMSAKRSEDKPMTVRIEETAGTEIPPEEDTGVREIHCEAEETVEGLSAEEMSGEPEWAAKQPETARASDDTKEWERIPVVVEKEDFLLSQIDEFREKAKQLQQLIAAKETKAQELQSIVNEREDKAQELETILSERQEEADRIVSEFTRAVDTLSGQVTSKMMEIERSMTGQVAEMRRASEEAHAVSRSLSEEQFAASRSLSEEQFAASQKLSEEQIAANRMFLEEQAIANKRQSDAQIAQVRELLENTTSQLTAIKTELSDKVHSENVKCYRNIQDLFGEFETKIEKMDELETGVGSVKGYVKTLSVFTILNFVILIVVLLCSVGVIHI